jgi:hypothetical protein
MFYFRKLCHRFAHSDAYVTHSDWLYEQWSDMSGWKSIDYQGLDRGACPPQWKGIMRHVETRVDQVRMVKLSESDIEQRIRNAVILFAHEGVQWYKDFSQFCRIPHWESPVSSAAV